MLVVAFSAVYAVKTKKRFRQMEELQRMYSDEHLAKMEYDIGACDGDIEKLIRSGGDPESQMTIDEVLTGDSDDGSGVEEITGNYKP